MDLTPLTALSPLDGRYYTLTNSLSPWFSEYALIQHRVFVEIKWLAYLIEIGLISMKAPETKLMRWTQLSLTDAQDIKRLEEKTKHDVKAIEYYLKIQFSKDKDLIHLIPFIHFACTSEDINNIAYSLMISNALHQVLLPCIHKNIQVLTHRAVQYADLSMLSRTHGQPASPTTLGKELANFSYRLHSASQQLSTLKLSAKMNGAVGNFNAHRLAYPNLDWPKLSERFVHSLGLENHPYTTQIEPHDNLAELLQIMTHINNVGLGLARDMWGYISLKYFQQHRSPEEVGSSTMPHKVNPIYFENAEGNFGLANALSVHMANKLVVSRWQRDLSDSTVIRNVGCVFGYSLIGYQNLLSGLNKIEADANEIQQDLMQHWEVLGEAVQTILRSHGQADAYEQLKAATQGKTFDQTEFLKLIDALPLALEVKKTLTALTPATYRGYARELADSIGDYL